MGKVSKPQLLPFGEFVSLMAFMTALIALTIDAMLPALTDIGKDLKVSDINDTQLIVSLIFLGMGIGQLFFGPLSDATGRKLSVLVGLILYLFGCVISGLSENLTTMLVGRFIQGLGVSGPRVVSMAIIRDLYSGRFMAKVMSYMMVIFILVPMVAPTLGLGILQIANWRAIFGTFLVLALLVLFWFMIRQCETLPVEKRIPISITNFISALKEICMNRLVMGYIFANGFTTGAFIGYLSTVQQVFQFQYGMGKLFPLIFAILSVAIGAAAFFNGKFVLKFGMNYLSWRSLIVFIIFSILFLMYTINLNGHPPLIIYMLYMVINLFTTGILFGNLNAMAMEPLGHIAGIGSAVVGSLSILIAFPIAVLIGKSYQGNINPIIWGFVLLGIFAALAMWWGQKKIDWSRNAP